MRHFCPSNSFSRIGALLIATVVFPACAGQRYAPDLNPSAESRFVIIGTKIADVEAHFEITYTADAEGCRIDRPYSEDVVRTQRDGRRSFGTGITEFDVEFFLDRYLPGECRWHPDAIQISVNRPPYNDFSAARTTIVSFRFVGTPGLNQVELVCLPEKPTWRALTCKGPIANFGNQPGRLHLSIVDES